MSCPVVREQNPTNPPRAALAFQNPFAALTNSQKWWYSFFFALLFLIISSNVAYGFTNTIFSGYFCTGQLYTPVGATFLGLLIHTLLFMLIIRWIMG